MPDTEDIKLQASTQLMGGGMGGIMQLTPEADTRRFHLVVPAERVIPVIFIPGIMGSHLRMSKKRREELKRKDNRAWRPDDAGATMARKDDTPKQRQLNFDPDETEVEVYNWTSDGAKFDLELAQDKRHDNVPDGLADLPPLLTSDPLPTGALADMIHARPAPNTATAAQKARWRGWSEVLFGSYGDLLKEMEARLNNAAAGGRVDDVWDFNYLHKSPASWAVEDPNHPAPTDALTAEELKKLSDAALPVHAMGYNWLKSNGDAGKQLAERIRELIRQYKKNGFLCDGVIVVTHSMGGLVARALIHPDYGNLKSEIIGVVHGVMPTHGAGATYKRIRAGAEGGAFWDLTANVTQKVLGATGKEVTAVLANAQGALELLPNALYGNEWLKVVDQNGQNLMSLPVTPEPLMRGALPPPPDTPAVREIYTRPAEQWWRLVNPAWVDPAEKYKGNKQAAMEAAKRRIEYALDFHLAIQETFHLDTYAHYCHDSRHRAWGEVVWKVESGDASLAVAGPAYTWELVEDNAQGLVKVRTRSGQFLSLRLQAAADAGDETVPAARSAAKVRGKTFVQRGYEHQNSYKDKNAVASTLYGVVKIAAKHLAGK